MREYWEQYTPTAMSAAEHQDVAMNAWQMIVADFDAEMADRKETFARNPSQQSVQEEYSIYVMGALSAGSTFDTLGFWKVRFLRSHHNIYSYKLLADARAYLSNNLSHRHGLLAHTSIRCPMRKGFLVQRWDRHEETEQDKAGVNGGSADPQVLPEESSPWFHCPFPP